MIEHSKTTDKVIEVVRQDLGLVTVVKDMYEVCCIVILCIHLITYTDTRYTHITTDNICGNGIMSYVLIIVDY